MGLLILFLAAYAVIVAVGTVALIHHMQSPPRYTYATALARREPTDPRDMGLEAIDRVIRLGDGAKTQAWIIAGELAPRVGPTIILSHGLADSRYGSLSRVPLLLPHASRIVLYDLRGHGESSARKSTLTAKEPDDLLHVMNELDDGSPIVLMGHSMGAGISMVVAAREKSDPRIAGVIAEGGYRWPMETIAGYLRHKGWPAQPFVWLAGAHFSFWLGITNRSFDRATVAADLACPLLVVNGANDVISPRESAKQVADAAERGRIEFIEGAAHSDLAIVNKERYADVLRGFFGQ
jgi:pimeloyl-ACP methyl ester carboxylesterase